MNKAYNVPGIPILLLLVLSLFSACTSIDPVETQSEEAQNPVEEEPQEEQSEPAVEEPETAQEDSQKDFEVSEEVFDQTFIEVEAVIAELNSLIRQEKYQEWLSYLTEDYREYYSSPEQLERYSQSERLQSAGIELETLEDFFLNVVVPSRANLRLDDLVFLDEKSVEAIMIVRDQRISVYRLRLVDNEWKIER